MHIIWDILLLFVFTHFSPLQRLLIFFSDRLGTKCHRDSFITCVFMSSLGLWCEGSPLELGAKGMLFIPNGMSRWYFAALSMNNHNWFHTHYSISHHVYSWFCCVFSVVISWIVADWNYSMLLRVSSLALGQPLIHCVFASLIAIFKGPTWGPSECGRTQVSPMLATWTLLSGVLFFS